MSNKACPDDTVRFCDSLQWGPDNEIKKQIASSACYDTSQILIECMNVHKQSGSDDCGLMTIAFVTCLLFEQDPVKVRFDQKRLRQHLLQCLNSGEMRPFPVLSYRSVRQQVLQRCKEDLHCTCRQVYIDGLRNDSMHFMQQLVP